jgi:hypothetical protein
MRSEYRIALDALTAVSAGLLLAACSTAAPYAGADVGEAHPNQAPQPPTAVAGPAPAPADAAMVAEAPPPAPPAAAISYPRYGDSDDYLCNFAPPGDPRTPAACLRLRGPGAVPEPVPRYGDSDDFVCHHGAPGDPRTLQACQRLRPPEP